VAAWTGAEAELCYPGWRCAGTFDVSGGWYDAGDFGKYVTSGAIAAWQLLSTLDLLAAHDPPPSCAGLRDTIVEECRWQLDWLLRMQVPAGDRLAGMAFHRVHGTRWPPLPCWPHEDPTERVLHRPSTGATLHLAAAAAQGARLLRAADPAYASTLLAAARTAYEAAHRRPYLLAPDDHARFGGGPYHDDDLTDDFYWAAAELWLATGEDRYLLDLRDSPQHTADGFDPAGFDFDRVTAPARLDLAVAGGPEHDGVRDSVLRGADRLLDLQARQPWGQPYAPATGWDWGSNGRILNNLVVLAVAHRVSGHARYHDAVAVGMDYLLGRNALGQSYITGYGVDSTRHQRTRQFGHDLDPAFAPPPPGTIAGGPNSTPAPDFPYDPRLVGLPPQCCYLDEPTSEVTNDVCIRWNAPLTWIATYLSIQRRG
jgi:endoglucanase